MALKLRCVISFAHLQTGYKLELSRICLDQDRKEIAPAECYNVKYENSQELTKFNLRSSPRHPVEKD